MKPTTTGDVRALLNGYLTSAALGAALESGLFWELAERPGTAPDVARALGIPAGRCHHWLELLTGLGLLAREGDAYGLTSAARSAILDAYSRETWALLAQEDRERYPAGRDLTVHIHQPGSVWAAQGLTAPDYIAQMRESPERARRFTRMLCEIHKPMAEELAGTLDMTGVRRLMDLGGGSGVMSLALLDRHPELTAAVVDMANVCPIGREIAAERGLAERITYHVLDFFQDELPSGFDLVLKCDIGVHTEALFRKAWGALKPGGRLVIVDELARANGAVPQFVMNQRFRSSLNAPDFNVSTVGGVQATLARVGFELLSEQVLSSGETVIQCRKGGST